MTELEKILALSKDGNGTPPSNGDKSPFVLACEHIWNLARFCSKLNLRVSALELQPGPRDGRDGLQGMEGPRGEAGLNGRDGNPGKDGSKINKINILNGNLILIVDDIEYNLGQVRGNDGKDGIGIKGDTGPAGSSGKDGKSIQDIKIENDHLIVNFDGEIRDLGNIKGDCGAEGQIGPSGKDGSSIVGEKGSIGPAGRDGESIKGDKGDPGSPGKDGKDADPKIILQLESKVEKIEEKIKDKELNDKDFEDRVSGLLGFKIKVD